MGLTNTRGRLKLDDGIEIALTGLDDPHIKRDRYAAVAGGPESGADLSLAIVHAPYLRVLDAFTADGYPLILAGHTHGGQLCIPFYGALVTNCDLDTDRVKGLSTHTAAGHTLLPPRLRGLRHQPLHPGPLRLPPGGDTADADRTGLSRGGDGRRGASVRGPRPSGGRSRRSGSGRGVRERLRVRGGRE